MFKVLSVDCVPTRGSKYSACVDLYSREDIVIGAGETVKVPLGVKIDLNDKMITRHLSEQTGQSLESMYNFSSKEDRFDTFCKMHYLQLEPRSSLRVKGLIVGTGIIDLDYKDEIMMVVHNPVNYKKGCEHDVYSMVEPYKITKGQKIAQIMLCEHKSYLFGIDTYEERQGGFGSSGE